MASEPPPLPPPTIPPPAHRLHVPAATRLGRAFGAALAVALNEARGQGMPGVCLRSRRGSAFFNSFLGKTTIFSGTNYRADRQACDASTYCDRDCASNCVHAEQAALLAALRANTSLVGWEGLHVKTIDGKLVPSGPPSCMECAKLMTQAGVVAFWLFHAELPTGGPGWTRYPMPDFLRTTQATRGLYVP